ncbi:MAG TPA: flagellar basal body-associated FliL family protein, partial [Cellvibrio sp.]
MLMQRIILAVLVVNTLVVAATAYINFSLLNQQQTLAATSTTEDPTSKPAPAKKSVKAEEYKFFAIEKIIISLPGEGREHYFVLDLVLQANTDTDEKKLQQIDPMVRNSVVAHLSSMTVNELRALSITDLQTRLEEAVSADFSSRHVVQPFAHVLVSKLVV